MVFLPSYSVRISPRDVWRAPGIQDMTWLVQSRVSQPCPEITCGSLDRQEPERCRMKSTRLVVSSKATLQRAVEPLTSRSTEKIPL